MAQALELASARPELPIICKFAIDKSDGFARWN